MYDDVVKILDYVIEQENELVEEFDREFENESNTYDKRAELSSKLWAYRNIRIFIQDLMGEKK